MDAYKNLTELFPTIGFSRVGIDIENKNIISSICEEEGYACFSVHNRIIRRTTQTEFEKIPNALWKIELENSELFVTPWDIIPSFMSEYSRSYIEEVKPFVLAQPFIHSSWLKDAGFTRREAIEYFALTQNYRLKKAPNERGLTTIQNNMDLSTTRLLSEEAWYYKDRKAFFTDFLSTHDISEVRNLYGCQKVYSYLTADGKCGSMSV